MIMIFLSIQLLLFPIPVNGGIQAVKTASPCMKC